MTLPKSNTIELSLGHKIMTVILTGTGTVAVYHRHHLHYRFTLFLVFHLRLRILPEIPACFV